MNRGLDYVIFAILAIFLVWLFVLTARGSRPATSVVTVSPSPTVFVVPSPTAAAFPSPTEQGVVIMSPSPSPVPSASVMVRTSPSASPDQ